jgi:hypothetical protein
MARLRVCFGVFQSLEWKVRKSMYPCKYPLGTERGNGTTLTGATR